MVYRCDVHYHVGRGELAIVCGDGGEMTFLNLIDDPVIAVICIGLGVIVASAACIWISVSKKEK